MSYRYLVDLKSVFSLASLPSELSLLTPGSPLFMKVFMDESLLIGDEVKSRTEGLQMLTATDFAFHELELVWYALHLVPQSTVVLVVHIGVLDGFYEAVVVHKEEDTVLDRTDFIIGPGLDNKVEVQQVGVVLHLDLLDVHDVILKGESTFLAEVADLPLLEDNEVIVIIEFLDDFIGMAHPHLYPLCQVVQRFAYEGFEELYMFENLLIGFLEVLLLELDRQVANELLLLLKIESLSQFSVFFNIVIDLPGELLIESVLFG